MTESNDHLIYAGGGEIDAGEFSLEITSEHLQPAEITLLLDLQPTAHHVRGEPFGSRGRVWEFGVWEFATGRLDFRSGCCFEEQFDDFVRALPDHPKAWERIAAQHHARVLVCLWMRTWNREFDVSPFALGELARRRLQLHIDTYLDADDETGQPD